MQVSAQTGELLAGTSVIKAIVGEPTALLQHSGIQDQNLAEDVCGRRLGE